MGSFDAYDPEVVFDDYAEGLAPGQCTVPSWSRPRVYGDDQPYSILGGFIETVRSMLWHARKRRRAPAPTIIGKASYDPTYRTFEVEGVVYRVIGQDAVTDTPIFDALKKRFDASDQPDRLVRVDDDESYAAFRAARRAPYLARLEANLRALEAAYADHAADDHAHGRVARLEEALARHIAQAQVGGDAIPLPLDQCVRGAIECWQDGNEILCTVRVSSPDWTTKMITSSAPADKHVDEMVGCAIASQAEPEFVIATAPYVVQVLGSTALIQRLCGVAGELMKRAKSTFVGVLQSTGDSDTAAVMTILQHCQMGDKRAMAEVRRLESKDPRLVSHALECLRRGQNEKVKALRSRSL
jgi:hypothetical protein